MKASELAALIGGTLVAAPADLELTGIATLGEATPSEVSFVTDRKFLSQLPASKAALFLVSSKFEATDRPHIALNDVWAGVLAALQVFFPGFARKHYSGVHETAVVDPSVRLGEGVTVAPNAVIGADSDIGNGTYVGPGVVIGPRCRLGENCTLYATAVLEADTVLGRGVYVQPGAVLGADGFKYEVISGKWTKIPQVGHVELGDNVEVGANTCIDRASYSVTEVGADTKIDNLVQIAHNVHLGENCVVVSQSGIAGSTTIGNNSILAAQTGVADNLKLGERVVIMGRSGVKDNVADGLTYLGFPAKPFGEEARILATMRKLPQMFSELNKLKTRVAELEAELEEKTSSNQ